MISATGGRIAGAILVAALGPGIAVSALAEPKLVTEIKGSKLFLYEKEEGKRVDSLNPEDVPLPLDILRESIKGKFLVKIPGKGELWILKAQTVTDKGPPKVSVDCQNITKSYAATRGFGDCN